MTLGAYSHSKGHEFIRKQVAKFINERDKTEGFIDSERIFLTNGASEAISRVLHTLSGTDESNGAGRSLGVLMPIPQYPLYKAELVLAGFEPIEYCLEETSTGWSLSKQQLLRAVEKKEQNAKPIALILINPGNPAGNCLQKGELAEVLMFAYERGLCVLADEVYQDNVYNAGNVFTSCRRVAIDLGIYNSGLRLFSFNSVSKGLMGECGRRGGYLECSPGIDDNFIFQLYKLSSISLSPNSQGQICVSIMTDPPKPDDESYKVWNSERLAIFESLERRAKKLHQAFNDILKGWSCAPALGSMYLFPRVLLPMKFIEKAKREGKAVDTLYALELLESTGVCLVPGNGFGISSKVVNRNEESGDCHCYYYLRSTFLPDEQEFDQFIERIRIFHNDEFLPKYLEN